MFSGNIGLAIRNLVKERENFIEEVCIVLKILNIILIRRKF